MNYKKQQILSGDFDYSQEKCYSLITSKILTDENIRKNITDIVNSIFNLENKPIKFNLIDIENKQFERTKLNIQNTINQYFKSENNEIFAFHTDCILLEHNIYSSNDSIFIGHHSDHLYNSDYINLCGFGVEFKKLENQAQKFKDTIRTEYENKNLITGINYHHVFFHEIYTRMFKELSEIPIDKLSEVISKFNIYFSRLNRLAAYFNYYFLLKNPQYKILDLYFNSSFDIKNFISSNYNYIAMYDVKNKKIYYDNYITFYLYNYAKNESQTLNNPNFTPAIFLENCANPQEFITDAKTKNNTNLSFIDYLVYVRLINGQFNISNVLITKTSNSDQSFFQYLSNNTEGDNSGFISLIIKSIIDKKTPEEKLKTILPTKWLQTPKPSPYDT